MLISVLSVVDQMEAVFDHPASKLFRFKTKLHLSVKLEVFCNQNFAIDVGCLITLER